MSENNKKKKSNLYRYSVNKNQACLKKILNVNEYLILRWNVSILSTLNLAAEKVLHNKPDLSKPALLYQLLAIFLQIVI